MLKIKITNGIIKELHITCAPHANFMNQFLIVEMDRIFNRKNSLLIILTCRN